MNPGAVIGLEKSLVLKHYNYVDCNVKSGVLYCYGSYQPTTESEKYNYRIKYQPYSPPITTIISPNIEYNEDIHMYPKNNSLCLYHKTDMTWNSSHHHLYDTIIPWTHEWFVFYELYLLHGKWLHPEVKHGSSKK